MIKNLQKKDYSEIPETELNIDENYLEIFEKELNYLFDGDKKNNIVHQEKLDMNNNFTSKNNFNNNQIKQCVKLNNDKKLNNNDKKLNNNDKKLNNNDDKKLNNKLNNNNDKKLNNKLNNNNKSNNKNKIYDENIKKNIKKNTNDEIVKLNLQDIEAIKLLIKYLN